MQERKYTLLVFRCHPSFVCDLPAVSTVSPSTFPQFGQIGVNGRKEG